jgi:4-hydroxy-3-methylbut-2-enyl diphosphate reductase
MKVMVARTAGFCKGVRDALDITLEAIQKRVDKERICTYGPLIHNRQVLATLEEKDVRAENRIEDCANKKVVIRAHGIPPQDRQMLHRLGAVLLDATCKRVAKVHAAIKQHARRGFHTIIAGDTDHAEVIGLLGYAEGRGHVVNRPEQINAFPEDWDKVLLVAQTTQNEELFLKIQEQFLKRYPAGVVKNTICGSTHERQAEVRRLCREVEAMVVVGGYHSGNTVRLSEVARELAVPTYHIETEADLNRQEMALYKLVGVSAGASTPSWIIRNVVQFLESIEPENGDVPFKLKQLLGKMAYANGWVPLAALLLWCAVQALTGLPGTYTGGLMGAFYLFAMHSLNKYLDRRAVQLNEPGRAAFYQRWRSVLTGLSLLSVLIVFGLALSMGGAVFLLALVFVSLGLAYAGPVIFPKGAQAWPIFNIKDIPTSKTLFVPLAWTVMLVLLPNLSHLWTAFGRLMYGSWIVFLIVFLRTALLDLAAVRGDRLAGRETLVVVMGETWAVRILWVGCGVLAMSLVGGPLWGLSTWFALFLLPAMAAFGWTLRESCISKFKEEPLFETCVESILMGAGLLGLLWNIVLG